VRRGKSGRVEKSGRYGKSGRIGKSMRTGKYGRSEEYGKREDMAEETILTIENLNIYFAQYDRGRKRGSCIRCGGLTAG